jgi:prepilin-type N-terminal cleavage/methylation domain-containing protein/prepilin-type processing-associated H-X9-DG protein
MNAHQGPLSRAAKRAAGFTLVELLVVMAVIIMLASITYPTIMGATTQAREMRCHNNLDQFGKALFMYGNNWDRYFPANRPPPKPSTGQPPAFNRGYDDLSQLYLQKFVDSIRLFNCPVTRDDASSLTNKDDWYKSLLYKRTGTALGWKKSGSSYVSEFNAPVPPGQLSYEYCGEFMPNLHLPNINSSRAWLMHDEDARNEDTQDVLRNRNLKKLELTVKSNHRGRNGNMLFLDGTVRIVAPLDWPGKVMTGIDEWSKVTGWFVPDDRLEPES